MVLCQFSVQNFKSFREETVLDLQAIDIVEFSSSLLPSPNQDKFRPLLPVTALYGPNGGGKSVLLEALVSLASKVLRPIVSVQAEKVHPYYPLALSAGRQVKEGAHRISGLLPDRYVRMQVPAVSAGPDGSGHGAH